MGKNYALCKLLWCRKGVRGRKGGKAEVPFVHPGSECSLRTHRTPKKMLHFKAPAQLLQALGGPSTQPATSTIIAFASASFDPSSIFFFSLSLSSSLPLARSPPSPSVQPRVGVQREARLLICSFLHAGDASRSEGDGVGGGGGGGEGRGGEG